MKFYDASNFCDQVFSSNLEDGVCCEKVIMTLLWSNVMAIDFTNLNVFLKRKIDFLDDTMMRKYTDRVILDYSNILEENI